MTVGNFRKSRNAKPYL